MNTRLRLLAQIGIPAPFKKNVLHPIEQQSERSSSKSSPDGILLTSQHHPKSIMSKSIKAKLGERNTLVLEHLPLADAIASRTAGRLFPLVERNYGPVRPIVAAAATL